MVGSKSSTLFLLGLLVFAVADEAPLNEEDTSNENLEGSYDSEDAPLGPSNFAKTTVLFPDYPDKKFVQGQFVEVLCGFKNTGDKSFNITTLKGSLISGYDFSMYIQNFTEQSPFTEIKNGEEGTLSYRFFPDPGLEPQHYILALHVDYIDADKEEFRTVYYNSSIEIVESQSSLDTRTFFGRILTLVSVAILGLVGYYGYKKYGSKKWSKADVKKGSEGKNEWLEGYSDSGNVRRGGSGKKLNSGKKSS